MSFTRWQASRTILATLALAGGIVAAAVPASAQDNDARVRKLEAEVKALQRKVFPGPDGKFFEPEVDTSNPATVQPQAVATPAPSAMTDILARLDAIEAQLNQLTARGEVNGHSITKLDDRVSALEARASGAAAPDAIVAANPSPDQPTGAIPLPGEPKRKAEANLAPTKAKSTGPTSDRLAKVQAVVKPQTDDPGDDEYSYGFRLWQAGLYPEAEQQLKLYVDKYPNHSEISYGRNLLGRAYLDDNQPKVAASYFLENYQKDPNGVRAPDSLLFLADSMMALKDNTRACRALAEFNDKYPALATGRLQDQYDKDRQQAGCK